MAKMGAILVVKKCAILKMRRKVNAGKFPAVPELQHVFPYRPSWQEPELVLDIQCLPRLFLWVQEAAVQVSYHAGSRQAVRD